MGEANKRHNRKIWRSCPICKGRVVLGHRNQDWWVYCEDNRSHIPQRFFPYAHEAIDEWNAKANKRSNGDRIRSKTDAELAELLTAVAKKSADKLCESLKSVEVDLSNCNFHILYEAHLDWLRQECEE